MHVFEARGFYFLLLLGKVGRLQVEQLEEAGAVGGPKLAKLRISLAIGNVGWPGCCCQVS